MAHLAIQGHATRGNEVIALLEMLGGKNIYKLDGEKDLWYILSNSTIEYSTYLFEEKGYTLDEFEARFPYKVGDEVISIYGKLGCISSIIWSYRNNQVRYELEADIDSFYFADELHPIKNEKPMKEKKINQMSLANCDLDEIEIVLGDKFELKIKGGKYYAVRKKPQYPTDYIDACSVLGISVTSQCEMDVVVFGDELYALYQLLVCRNAYWKIVGMEMRLGESWKPDWNNISDKHCIYVVGGEIWLKECQTRQCTLAFPTAEMRDTFYENFKDLIEQCKDLL